LKPTLPERFGVSALVEGLFPVQEFDRMKPRTLLLGTAALAVCVFVGAADKPKTALAPHWLDEVVGSRTDEKQIAKELARNERFLKIVREAVSEAKKAPPVIGPSYAQRVRVAIIKGISDAPRDP